MVNKPQLTMDDYGILEPTDVGNLTIDYEKEDYKKRVSRWDQDEVLAMLSLIKENGFINRYSVTKMSTILSQLMLKKGWRRTEKQVHVKLTMLRKNFLAHERQKLSNIPGLKECPFYKELCDIYEDLKDSNSIDSDDFDSTFGHEEELIKFPNDPLEWTRIEVQKMLNIIKSMKIKNELTLTFFSPVAVRMVAEGMQNAGYDRTTEQVKNALINLRAMYIDYKLAIDSNENPQECLFINCLDMFWSREYKKCRFKEKKKTPTKTDDPWPKEETIMLLTIIQDSDIAEETYKRPEVVAEDLREDMAENGYTRSRHEIINRLIQLKKDFDAANKLSEAMQAMKQFPFYFLYKRLFNNQINSEATNRTNHVTTNHATDGKKNSPDRTNFHKDINKEICNKDVKWSTEEVELLLRTLKTLASDSLEEEKLQNLVKTFKEAGYHKSAEQIKHKLTLLKKSYLKCNLEDSTEEDIYECPFYNELHDIFRKDVSDERYEFIQNLLTENSDTKNSKIADHSYTNTKYSTPTKHNNMITDKVTVIATKSLETWLPVESIMNGGKTLSNLETSNLNTVSTKDQEKVIEQAILSILPSNSDPNIDENYVPSIVSDVVLDEEIVTTNDRDDVKNHKRERSLDQSDSSSQGLATRSDDSQVENGLPPSKRPRITTESNNSHDDKLSSSTSKNKVLLRPVDASKSSLTANAIGNSKFVRLIVANEPNRNGDQQHITAHIEKLNFNGPATAASSVSSGMSSPVERSDIIRLAAERALGKDDFDEHKSDTDGKDCGGANRCHHLESVNCIAHTVSKTIRESIQNMMRHDELLQQSHQAWLERQYEKQRKESDDQNKILMNEIKELRSIVSVLLADKQSRVNDQER